MKEKVNKYISSLDSIIYVLSHAIKIQLFWSQLRANDVLPRVLTFIIIIIIILNRSRTFNSNTWMILYYDMWPNINMPYGIKL